MFSSIARLFKRPLKTEAASVHLKVVRAMCDVQRPMLRREDLERINQTHQDLQKDIEDTRDQARQLAQNLSSELELAKMRVSIISDSLMDPLISVDVNGCVVSTNQTVERILGFSASDLLHNSIQHLLDGSFDCVKFKEEALRYTTYLKHYNPTNIVEYRDLYRDYIKTSPDTILNKTNSVTCVTRTGQLLPAEMYCNIFNVDCTSMDSIIFLVVFKDNSEVVAATSEVEELTQFQLTLLSALPNPVFYKDAAFKILGCNRAFCEFLGKPQESIVGKTNAELFGNGTTRALDLIDISLLDANSPDIQSHKIEMKTETDVREVMLYVTALRTKDGEYKGSLETFIDLTDLLSMRRFKEALIHSVPAPIYYLDRDLKYKGCNDKYAALVGVSKDEIIGRTREQVLFSGNPNSVGILAEFYRQKDFEILTSCNTGQLYETQMYNRLKDKLIDVLVYRAVLKSPDGKFDGIVAVVTDVTEIRAVQRFHQKIFDSCPLPIYYKNKTLEYVTCNTLYADWYGLRREDLVGKTREQLIECLMAAVRHDPVKLEKLRKLYSDHQDLIAAHRENDQLLSSSSEPGVIVFEHRFWNFQLEEMRDVIFYKHSLFGPEGFDGIICSMIDVTDLRGAEKIGTSVLEAIPLPIAYCNTSGIIQQCNSNYCKLVGRTKNEVVGQYVGNEPLRRYHLSDTEQFAVENTVYGVTLQDYSGVQKDYTILKRSVDDAVLFIYFNKGTLHEALSLNL